MIKTFFTLFASLSLILPQASPVTGNHPPAKLAPAYAKWGLLAMQETMKKYPNANILDYLHVGRVQLSPSTTQETFKFWLKDQQKEFGVYVKIQFLTASEQVLSTEFQPANH